MIIPHHENLRLASEGQRIEDLLDSDPHNYKNMWSMNCYRCFAITRFVWNDVVTHEPTGGSPKHSSYCLRRFVVGGPYWTAEQVTNVSEEEVQWWLQERKPIVVPVQNSGKREMECFDLMLWSTLKQTTKNIKRYYMVCYQMPRTEQLSHVV